MAAARRASSAVTGTSAIVCSRSGTAAVMTPSPLGYQKACMGDRPRPAPPKVPIATIRKNVDHEGNGVAASHPGKSFREETHGHAARAVAVIDADCRPRPAGGGAEKIRPRRHRQRDQDRPNHAL